MMSFPVNTCCCEAMWDAREERLTLWAMALHKDRCVTHTLLANKTRAPDARTSAGQFTETWPRSASS